MAVNRKIKPPRKKHAGIWALVMAVFLAELLFYTWCRVQCVRLGYDINKETQRHRNLTTLQANLKIELESLMAPERIAGYAKTKLDLVIPGPERVVIVK